LIRSSRRAKARKSGHGWPGQAVQASRKTETGLSRSGGQVFFRGRSKEKRSERKLGSFFCLAEEDGLLPGTISVFIRATDGFLFPCPGRFSGNAEKHLIEGRFRAEAAVQGELEDGLLRMLDDEALDLPYPIFI